MEKPRQQMEVNTPRRKRYRFNAKKLGITLISLGCVAVLAALAIQQSDSRTASSATAAPPSPTEVFQALKDKCIVVDAGHGGFDPGAIGASGAREDELNLKVAKLLEAGLEEQGAQVIMTRGDDDAIAATKDEDMAERRRIIEQSGSDIVISVHMNSHPDSAVSGPLVLFMPGSASGQRLADSIMDCLNDALSADGAARGERLYILKSGSQPCVLVECGYISNALEEANLQREDYQQRIADAILEGVAAYFGG